MQAALKARRPTKGPADRTAIAAFVAMALLGLVSCVTRAPRNETTSPILAGAASRVITPELGPGRRVWIAGFDRREATGVHDDLYARALVLQAGSQSVALVALDLIGLFHDDVERIREEVRRRAPGVGVEYVLVSSTHTHAGPDVIGLWTPEGASPDEAYVERVRREAANAVEEAWRSRRPARLSFASAHLPELIRDSRLPIVVDDLALLLKVDRADDATTIATVVNFANHPESLGRRNTEISSDYPWAARRELEDTFGGVSLFFSGALGGLLTPLGVELKEPGTGEPVPPQSFRMTEFLGRSVAHALVAALEAPLALAAIETRSQEIQVPLTNPRFLEGLARGRIRPRFLDGNGALRSEVAVVTFREARADPVAQLACVPGEMYPELAIGGIQDPQDPGSDLQGERPEPPLRSLMSGRYRFVLGLCNDELGYIIPASQWDERPPFAYGRDAPQYGEVNSTGASTAPIVLGAFTDLLR